jgi:hypothetical protein
LTALTVPTGTLDLLEGIEDHPSEDVMLLKAALRDFIREQEEAV